MKNLTLATLALLCILSVAAFTSQNQTASGTSSAETVDSAASSPVRILSPRPGEKLQQNAVSVRYAFEPKQNAPAPPTPNYFVRLDDRDPIQIQDTEVNFTGLTAGQHTVTVELVDANGIAVAGARSQLQFSVAAQVPARSGQQGVQTPRTNPRRPPQSKLLPQAEEQQPSEASVLFGLDDSAENALRSTSDELASGNSIPLFSCIGAGVLLGGWLSARRTSR
jgi:hypothetical protein